MRSGSSKKRVGRIAQVARDLSRMRARWVARTRAAREGRGELTQSSCMYRASGSYL